MLQLGVESLTWLGITLCISQSAMFSGMNLAMFSLSRLHLEVEVASGNTAAATVLSIRRDSHFLLSTILWGNVSANVLLTLLSDSVLMGLGAFVFSTFVITIFGEIGPQAYFSRHALTVAVRLVPLLRLYQVLLFPIAKPSAMLLDWWLGREGIQYFREHNLRELIRRHIDSPEASGIDRLEGLGALNFLSMDDLPVAMEGESVDPMSIVPLPSGPNGPVFPKYFSSPDDPFLKAVGASGKKWVIVTDELNEPMVVLDSSEFLRQALFRPSPADPIRFCHRPVIVKAQSTLLGSVLSKLQYRAAGQSDKMIELDVILLWGESKRVITGTDILALLMAGIPSQLAKPMDRGAAPAG